MMSIIGELPGRRDGFQGKILGRPDGRLAGRINGQSDAIRGVFRAGVEAVCRA
jgi:hypothetical protein